MMIESYPNLPIGARYPTLSPCLNSDRCNHNSQHHRIQQRPTIQRTFSTPYRIQSICKFAKTPSFPRKRESRRKTWTLFFQPPDFTGVTGKSNLQTGWIRI